MVLPMEIGVEAVGVVDSTHVVVQEWGIGCQLIVRMNVTVITIYVTALVQT